MADSRLVIFGTGGAWSTAERDATWLAFENGSAAALIDCGGSPVQRLERAGCDFRRLDLVFLTHLHVDHVYGLPALLQTLVLAGFERRLRLACPAGEEGALAGVIDAHGLRRDLGLALLPLAPGAILELAGGGALEAMATDHSRPSMGVLVHPPAGPALVYTSDTAPLERWPAAARGTTCLVHECTFADEETERALRYRHSTPADAARAALALAAGRLILTHLAPGLDAVRAVRQAEAVLAGRLPVRVPADGETIWTGSAGRPVVDRVPGDDYDDRL